MVPDSRGADGRLSSNERLQRIGLYCHCHRCQHRPRSKLRLASQFTAGRDGFRKAEANLSSGLLFRPLGVLIGHYLQRVSRNLDLGTELIMQYGKSVPNGHMAFYSLGWRYFGKQWQLSGTLNPLGSLHLCYHHQSTSPIQFGVELESNIRTMESQCTFGYQVDLNKANMTFRGKSVSVRAFVSLNDQCWPLCCFRYGRLELDCRRCTGETSLAAPVHVRSQRFPQSCQAVLSIWYWFNDRLTEIASLTGLVFSSHRNSSPHHTPHLHRNKEHNVRLKLKTFIFPHLFVISFVWYFLLQTDSREVTWIKINQNKSKLSF